MSLVVSVLIAILAVAMNSRLALAKCMSLETVARCETLPSKDNPLLLNDTVVFLYITKAVGEIKEGSFQAFSNMESLELYPGITSIHPGAFDGLDSLISMNLFNNSIQRIEIGTFRGCSSLKTLVVGRNKITHIEANAFQDLSSLTFLDLSHNPGIEVFADSMFSGLHELTFLQCVNCGLRLIEPSAFKGALKCRGLNLRLNNLTEVDGTEFETLFELDELNLSSNNITRFDVDVLLRRNENLKTLMLRKNVFSCEDVVDIKNRCQIKGVTVHMLAYGEDACRDLRSEETKIEI